MKKLYISSKIKTKKIIHYFCNPWLYKKLFVWLLLFLFIFSQSFSVVGAQSASESALGQLKKLLNSNILFYDPVSCASSDASVSGSSEGGPLTGVHFPKLADKAILAKAIDNYIKDGWPDSPLVGYGNKFVANGEKYDVNPLISVVIAQVEYQMGTLSQYVGKGTPGQYNFWAVTHGGSGVRFGAYPSIDEAMKEHFALLGGKRSPSYIGPPQNFTTISQIMNQYAPSFENDTPGYIDNIIKGMKKILADGGVTTTGEATDSEPVDAGDPGCNGAGSISSSPDCQSASGNEKILCEAKKYEGIYYVYGAGHAGYSAFRSGCPLNKVDDFAAKSTVQNPGPCATDCSSLVSIAVDEAFGKSYMWSVAGSMQGAGSEEWKKVAINQAKPGDIVTNLDHVEIVDHVSGDSIFTFGSHHTGAKTGSRTSTISSNYYTAAYRWSE